MELSRTRLLTSLGILALYHQTLPLHANTNQSAVSDWEA